MENIIEKIFERLLSRIDSLMSATQDEEKINAILDRAIRILEIYASIKGL